MRRLHLLIASTIFAVAAQPTPKIVATLTPSGTGRLQGTVSFEKGRRDNETRARVQLVNAPATAQLGWTVRRGPCGQNAGEVGSVAAYRPLQTRGDGSVELSVNLPMPLPSDGAYHVDILQERGSNVVLACGLLAEDTGK